MCKDDGWFIRHVEPPNACCRPSDNLTDSGASSTVTSWMPVRFRLAAVNERFDQFLLSYDGSVRLGLAPLASEPRSTRGWWRCLKLSDIERLFGESGIARKQ